MRKRPEGFRQHLKFLHLQRRFAGLGQKTFPFDSDEIAEVEQREKIDNSVAGLPGIDVNLNAPGRVAKIDKVALAHIAMCGNPPGRTEDGTLLEFLTHVSDRAARFKR